MKQVERAAFAAVSLRLLLLQCNRFLTTHPQEFTFRAKMGVFQSVTEKESWRFDQSHTLPGL